VSAVLRMQLRDVAPTEYLKAFHWPIVPPTGERSPSDMMARAPVRPLPAGSAGDYYRSSMDDFLP
jgi:hypothetical protein